MSDILPALRKKIFRGYVLIVAIFGIVGTFLILTAVFTATSHTSKAIHRNYDTIEAAQKMKDAWSTLHFPLSYPDRTPKSATQMMEDALRFQAGNITEQGEREITLRLQDHWARWKSGECGAFCVSQMNGDLDQLIDVNKHAMFSFLDESRRVRIHVVIGVVIFFAIALIVTLLLVDSLSMRLANPLKAIAEVLRSKPKAGEKLKLPAPTSLEVRILTEELQSLWERVSRAAQVNVDEIIKQRTQLESLLSSVEDAVLVVDAEGMVTHVSEHMAALLRLPHDKIVGKKWFDIPTLSPNYLKLRDVYRERESPAQVIELHLESDGARAYAARFRDVQSSKGEHVSTIFLLHDITEVRQRDRLKGEFIGVLSHELKTPIQSLGTATELLQARKESLDGRNRLLVETLVEDVARIKTVAQQLMQLGQLSETAIRVLPQALCLSELLPQWIKPFELLASDKGVRLEFKHEGSERIHADIDPMKFPWVISNLISNAIRVAPEGSKIGVLITDRNGFSEIKVSDEGPGIPEDIEKRMFEPYYQGPRRVNSAIAGVSGFLGLGLTIAKEITDAHGGKIEYHPVKPHGAIFRVLLPLKIL